MGGTHFDFGKEQATTALEEDGGGINMTADGDELHIHDLGLALWRAELGLALGSSAPQRPAKI